MISNIFRENLTKLVDSGNMKGLLELLSTGKESKSILETQLSVVNTKLSMIESCIKELEDKDQLHIFDGKDLP